MEFNLRKFSAKDIAPVARIITNIGWKEFKGAFDSEDVKKMIGKGELDIAVIGSSVFFDIIGTILAHLPSCEKDIFTLLADLTGLSVEEIGNIPIDEFAELLYTIFKKDEFKGFLKVVSRFLK